LLDGAAEMVAATEPDVQVSALMHIADNYQLFDRKKAVEYFRQAFTAAGTPPGNNSPFARSAQADMVVMVAGMDSVAALELIKQIEPRTGGYDNRAFAAGRLIAVLLGKNEIGAAMDLADFLGSSGAYPFWGVAQIMGKLPEGDSQRSALFSSALAAYCIKPDRGFNSLVMKHHKEVPPGMAQAAMQKIVSTILDRKDTDENYRPETLASARGTVTFTSRQDAELFDVMPLVREIDPKRYEELLSKHAELSSALQMFPGGGPSVADDRGVTMYTVSASSNSKDPAAEKRAVDALNSRVKMEALIKTRSEAAMQAATKDPDKALDLVADIPSPPKQAEVLGRIAQSVAENDAARARRVLARCVGLLDDVKYPSDRVVPWDEVAIAAARIKDDSLVQLAVDRLLADAAALYKEDADSDRPNRAWRENWPSTQAYRRAVIRATSLLNVDAEPLLEKIADTDINVLARITMAQTLLGRPNDDFQTYGGRTHPPQLATGK
jgi:hypothetical protein